MANKTYVPYREIESGEIVMIEKSVYDQMQYWRNKMQKFIFPDGKPRGSIMITSTNAEEGSSPFYELWNSENK